MQGSGSNIPQAIFNEVGFDFAAALAVFSYAIVTLRGLTISLIQINRNFYL